MHTSTDCEPEDLPIFCLLDLDNLSLKTAGKGKVRAIISHYREPHVYNVDHLDM